MEPKHRGAANELRAVLWLLDQGYEVFRNVSQHGAIDLIAVRDNKTLYLDVRTFNSKRASHEQAKYGVKFLFVSADGLFEIFDPQPPLSEIMCKQCNKNFLPRRSDQVYCGRRCKNANAIKRARKPA